MPEGSVVQGLRSKTFNTHHSHPSQWLLGHLSLELSDNGRGKRVFKRSFIIVETLRETRRNPLKLQKVLSKGSKHQ